MSNSRRTSPQRSNRTRRRSMTLRDAASEFVRHPSPWMIGARSPHSPPFSETAGARESQAAVSAPVVPKPPVKL